MIQEHVSKWLAEPLGFLYWCCAVQDLIHIGRGYSAGSEHLCKHAKPEYAACLHIARKQGMAIVGKTNLSEFASQYRIFSKCRAGQQLFGW